MEVSEILAIHQALLAGDPVAPRNLIRLFGERLTYFVRKSVPFLSEEAAQDCAFDALMALIKEPGRFQSDKSHLMTYLSVIARNHAISHIRKEISARRHLTIEYVGGSVELDLAATNKRENSPYTGPAGSDPDALAPEWEALLQELLPSPRDRKIWDLICEGRTDYADFAAVLGVADLPPAEQKSEIKRNRDRVQKRMQRNKDAFRRLL